MMENNINTMLQFPIATFYIKRANYKQRSIGNRMTKNVEYLVTNARYNCHALDMCVPFSVSQTTFTVVRAEHVMVCRSIGTV